VSGLDATRLFKVSVPVPEYLNVTFVAAVGTGQKAVLNVVDDGGGSPQLVNVTGNGT
jgi:hypothetical protein